MSHDVAPRKISGQFAPRMIEMLRSPAMRALSLTGRRILDRIEIELAEHGGNDNGKLPVTHRDFEQFGINRNAIGAGIREASALGFIKQTQRGFAERRVPQPELIRAHLSACRPSGADQRLATDRDASRRRRGSPLRPGSGIETQISHPH